MSAYACTREREEYQVTTLPGAPPEAQLIAQLREAKVPVMSMREAARRAAQIAPNGFSVATWTQNEQGYRKVTDGVVIPIRATDERLAYMALVVGAAPGQLETAGRPEAAVILKKLLAAGPDPLADTIEAVRASKDLTEQQRRVILDAIQRNDPRQG